MAERPPSFFGTPTYRPINADVARFVEAIRDVSKKSGRARKLKLATSAMHAISAFVAQEAGPREALAILDGLRGDLIEALETV